MNRVYAGLLSVCLLLTLLCGCQQTIILSGDETMTTVDDTNKTGETVGETDGTVVTDAAGKTEAGKTEAGKANTVDTGKATEGKVSTTRRSVSRTTKPQTTVNPYKKHTETMKALLDAGTMNLNGRATISDTKMILNYSNTGFTITGNLSGAISAEVKAPEKNFLLNVVVDGKLVNSIRLAKNTSTVQLCTVTAGNHVVEVTSGSTPNYGKPEINKITYTGTLYAPPGILLNCKYC